MSKEKLHILFINSWYPSKILPNNGDFIQRHAEAVALKNKVTVIHVITDKSINYTEISDKNINGIRTIIAYIKPIRLKFNKLYQFYKTYFKLISLSGEFDIVHVNRLYPVGIIAVFLKLFKGKRFIISEHFTGYLQAHSNNINRTELFLSKIIVKQASYVCPVSENLKQNMQILGLEGNYKIVPNVVDTDVFTPKENNNEPFTLIHLSSLVDEHKNITGILNAIGKLQDHIPDFLFYLIGDNPFQYQDLIDSLKINPKNIKLIDQIKHHEVSKYLQKSNVLILFSNYENLPCVILEAFACGVKVISTNVGGIHEFFPSTYGKLINVKEGNQLLNEIINLYNENKNLQKNEMHKYAEDHFSKEKINDEFSILYHSILAKE